MFTDYLKNKFDTTPFKFSIIMAIYNSEDYLKESIESVIAQDIGFKSIELILIDDGSSDNSKEICLKYQSKYPENIKYIYQENQGQSSARNNGMKNATGKYLNFLDSDDKLESNALRLVYDFFEKNYDLTDVVSIPLKFFENDTGEHILNYKYYETRLVDLDLEPSYIQLSASSSFIKKSAVGNNEFDSKLIVSEDALFINKILLEKRKHGVVSNTAYLYRKRNAKTSTIDSSVAKKEYYIDRSQRFFKELFDYSKNKYGNIPDFIKYTVMYDIQWMFYIKNIAEILNENELTQLYAILHDILNEIDDEIILDQKHPDSSLINTILLFKHGKSETIKDSNSHNVFKKIGNTTIDKLNYHPLYIDAVEINNDELHILGYLKSFFEIEKIKIQAVKFNKNAFLNYWLDYFNKNKVAFIKKRFLTQYGKNIQDYLLYSYDRYDDLDVNQCLNENAYFDLKEYYDLKEIDNLIKEGVVNTYTYNRLYEKYNDFFIKKLGHIYDAAHVDYSYRDDKYLNLDYNPSYNFECRIPLNILENSTVQLRVIYEDLIFNLDLFTNYYSKLTKESFYSKKENYLITLRNNSFDIIPYTFDDILRLEKENIDYLISQNDPELEEVIEFRKQYYDAIPKYGHKRIWLFNDRLDSAGDNAEQLYRYASNQNDGIEKYFIISEESNDYGRLKELGNIIPFKSDEHKILSCFAEKIITSHPNEDLINPFFDLGEKYYNGLFSAKVCFLQHGIILHDISSWLHKYNKYFYLFVTSAKKEFESILENPYNYDENTVQLLGLPRYDNLQSGNEKNKIIIMPTWRNFIEDLSDSQIKELEYFKRWNNLLNNEELLKFVQENNYEIIFKPHININEHIKLFDLDNVTFNQDISYNTAFNESKLLITDYSSVVFDFAYLKKPVLYYQWKNDEFHFDLSKSYFNYKEMGFGEIADNETELINLIKQYIANDCQMQEKYQQRVDEFYEYHDKNNCKRVYEFILNMKK